MACYNCKLLLMKLKPILYLPVESVGDRYKASEQGMKALPPLRGRAVR